MKCNNCDGIGHTWRECTDPKDWSRVKCTNCQKMGMWILLADFASVLTTDRSHVQALHGAPG
jgi:hypothetical protein